MDAQAEAPPQIPPAVAAQVDALVAEYVPNARPGLQLAVGRGGTVELLGLCK